MLNKQQLRKLRRAESSGYLTVWYKDGQPHREDGPAIYTVTRENEYWMSRGSYHRIGGPAMLFDGIHIWRVHGFELMSYRHYQRRTKCTDEELVVLQLKWGHMTASSVAGLAIIR